MKLILASSSPRRKWLLKESGYSFKIIRPKIEEMTKKGESPKSMVKRLAKEKALDVDQRVNEKKYKLLAADTIVVAPGNKEILCKPKDKKDAKRMLRKISGKVHEVITGYCVIHFNGKKRKIINKTVSTKVKIKKMNEKEISQYLAKGESMDKAGAYAAQGFGMTIIEKVNGSFTNVVGLPLSEVHHDLKG